MRNKNMRGKRGMAMVSVMFAMTIVMLFGVLITANAMNAGNAVKLYEVNTKQRNKLSEVGEYFVAEVAKVTDLSDATTTAEALKTAIKNRFPDLTYDFVVTAPTDGNINGEYTLSVQRTVKTETPAEEGGETIPAEYKIYFAVKVQKNSNNVKILTWRYGV